MKKTNTIRIFSLLILVLGLVSCLALYGCGGKDSGEAEQTDESATLPEDTGDQMLMDTSAAVAETPKEEVKKPEVQQPKEQPKPKPKEEPKPKQPEIVRETIIPAEAILKVEMLTKISTGENKIGDPFRANFLESGEEGVTLSLPAGTVLEGVVADINDGKAEDEKAYIKLKFTTLMVPGEKGIPMEGYLLNKEGDGYLRPGGQGTTIAKDAGVGAVAGAVLGGILGKKGDKTETAAKGAAAGAVVGGIAGAILHKDQVTLNEGAKFNIGVVGAAVKETVKN